MTKKYAFLSFSDPPLTNAMMEAIVQALKPLSKESGYDFVVLSNKLESISKDDLIKLIERLK